MAGERGLSVSSGASGVSQKGLSASSGHSISDAAAGNRDGLEAGLWGIGRRLYNWYWAPPKKEKHAQVPRVADLRRAQVQAFSDELKHNRVYSPYKFADMVREKFKNLAPLLKTPEEIGETRTAFLLVIKKEFHRLSDLNEVLALLPEFTKKVLSSTVVRENDARFGELLPHVKREFQKRLVEFSDKSDEMLAKMGLSRTHSHEGNRFPKALRLELTGTQVTKREEMEMQWNAELARAHFCPYAALRIAERYFNGDKAAGVPRDPQRAEMYVLQAMQVVNRNEPDEVEMVLEAYDKYNVGLGIRSVQEMTKALRTYKEAYFYYAWLMNTQDPSQKKMVRKDFNEAGIQQGDSSETVLPFSYTVLKSIEDIQIDAKNGNTQASRILAQSYASDARSQTAPDEKKSKATMAGFFYVQASKQDPSGVADYFAFEFFSSDLWRDFGNDKGKEYSILRARFHARRAKERLTPENIEIFKGWKIDLEELDRYLARTLHSEKGEVHGLPSDTDLPPNLLRSDPDVRRAVNLQKNGKDKELVAFLNKNPVIVQKVKDAANNREIEALKVLAVFWEKNLGGEGLLAWIAALELMPHSAQLQEEFLEIGRRALKGIRAGLGDEAVPHVKLFIDMMLKVNQHHQYAHPDRARVWDEVVIPEIKQTIEFLKRENPELAKNIGKGMWKKESDARKSVRDNHKGYSAQRVEF